MDGQWLGVGSDEARYEYMPPRSDLESRVERLEVAVLAVTTFLKQTSPGFARRFPSDFKMSGPPDHLRALIGAPEPPERRKGARRPPDTSDPQYSPQASQLHPQTILRSLPWLSSRQ